MEAAAGVACHSCWDCPVIEELMVELDLQSNAVHLESHARRPAVSQNSADECAEVSEMPEPDCSNTRT